MTPFLFGPPAHRLYGVYHAPASVHNAKLQVLLCPPFGQEAVRMHRLYRLLAEQLARQGVHVMRFDYFGTGESAGQDEDGTLAHWRNDIVLAQTELGLRTRATQTVWLGVRLGATLAMMASALSPTVPNRLVLWEPLLDGPSYLKELGEAHLAQTYDPYIQSKCPPQEVHDEIIGFGIGPTWLGEMKTLSVKDLNPASKADCIHISTKVSTQANELAQQQLAKGQPWRHLTAPGPDIAWHVEEANGAALAPPELLRLLIASVKGEAT